MVAAIGPVTAETLRKVGLAPDVVPERASAPALVQAGRGTRVGVLDEGGSLETLAAENFRQREIAVVQPVAEMPDSGRRGVERGHEART